ncbi:MAG: archease [Deltaproteobacteria bacterium]|nr:archease [Deltaproteobacteria bacterium]
MPYNGLMASKPKPYRLIDHTGDLGLEVRGADLPGLFSNAALAFTDILVAVETIRADQPQTIRVEAPDREALLAAWLGELLYLFDARRLLFGRFEISELTDQTLTARAWGEPFDPDRHGFKHDVKAVTYHQLQIRETAKGWRARVILDI